MPKIYNFFIIFQLLFNKIQYLKKKKKWLKKSINFKFKKAVN